MNAIPDALQRARALDPGHSFIVQAPAGSGKTELLIQRYLTLLVRVEQPESVVAITFTRKAAGEMQRRVIQALRDSAGPQPEAKHAALTWKLATAVRGQSDALGWDLFSNPSRLRIRTIDSLSAALTRQMPWVSRLGAPPEILDDASELYSEAARCAVDLLEGSPWSPHVEALLIHLDNDYRLLQKLIAAMLARRDQWLRHVVKEGDPDKTRATLEAAMENLIRDAAAHAIQLTPANLAGEIAFVAAAAGGHLAAEGREGRAIDCVGLRTLPGTQDLPAWLGIADILLTAADDWRKRPDVRQGIPATDKHLKQRCLAILEGLSGNDPYRQALADLRRLPEPRYTEPQWQALQALLKLLPVAAAQLQVQFRKAGAADYAEGAMAAQRALGDEENPTDLAFSLDYQIQHLLIDEFQDTSVSQYELLKRLTAGWEMGDGRTIFAVGDPMQSIYRFREAVVGLFLKASQEGIGAVPLEPLVLSANFRSDEGVVRWVNQAFPQVLPGEADITTGAIPFSPSDPVLPLNLDPAVQIHPFIGKDSDAEAAKVVELIGAARERQAGKIAVLVRARSHLESILPALRAAGLRFRAVEIDALDMVPVIQDLTALTRALLHPGDRIAWLAILRAPWCGISLRGLHALATDGGAAAVWDLIHDESRVQALEPDDQARLRRTRSALEQAFATHQSGLRRRVEGAWTALGGPACAPTRTDLDNAGVFLGLLETLDRGDLLDFAELEKRIADLYASPDNEADESLQIMTIHKAKGLEFEVVIIPGLGRKPMADESRLMLWLERARLGAEPDLLMAPIHATGGDADAAYEYLKLIEKRKADFETGRLLYVAATRAKSEVHLLGHTEFKADNGVVELRKPESSSLLHAIWPVAEPVFAAAAATVHPPAAEPAEEAPARPPQAIRRITLDWRLPAVPSAVVIPGLRTIPETAAEAVSFHWVGNTLRHVGTVVHQMLRRIAEDSADRWTVERIRGLRPSYRSALAAMGVTVSELSQAVDRVAESLAATLSDERGRWVLAGGERSACEFPVCGVVNGDLVSARIDRTFLDPDGTRWVVDYKTSSHEGAGADAFLDNERERYAHQLQTYQRLFTALENRPVRAALYFPLLHAWREIEMTEGHGQAGTVGA
jgi:ATP-dependent exoDNAse (exonuclease V) beta subunit